MGSPTVNYKNHRFPPQIIARAVWLYFRFPLSLRLVEELLVIAAALCIKPRGLLTDRQARKVDALKHGSDAFAEMRRLAMRFHGILRGKRSAPLDAWIDDAIDSELIPIMRFARVLRRDIDAVNNAIELPWSNGQAEGQINRLKTLKRAMYGRAGPELLRARMLPPRHAK